MASGSCARKSWCLPKCCLIAESRLGRYGFDTVIFKEGFVLEDASPAAKIMARLEREGYAISRSERVRP